MKTLIPALIAAVLSVVAALAPFASRGEAQTTPITAGTVRRVAAGDCVSHVGSMRPGPAGGLRAYYAGSGSDHVRCSIHNHLGNAKYATLIAYVTRHSPAQADGYCRSRIVEDFGATPQGVSTTYGPSTYYQAAGPNEDPVLAPSGTFALGWWHVHCVFPKPSSTGQTTYTLWGFDVTE